MREAAETLEFWADFAFWSSLPSLRSNLVPRSHRVCWKCSCGPTRRTSSLSFPAHGYFHLMQHRVRSVVPVVCLCAIGSFVALVLFS